MLPLQAGAWPPRRAARASVALMMRIAPRLHRVVWPALIAAVLGAPVVVTLAGRVPNIVEADVAPRLLEWPVRAVDMDHRALADGATLAGTGLRLDQPEGLAAHDELRLAVQLYGAAANLIRGEIWLAGTDCFYRTPAGSTFTDHEYLTFHRGRECVRGIQGHPTGVLVVRIELRGTERIGLMTSDVPAASAGPNWITRPDIHRGPDGPVSVVWARYADTYVGGERRRSDLLGYVWQVSDSSVWLWVAVGIALMSVFVGGILLWPGSSGPSPSRAGRILAVSAGVAGVGLGVALLYAVLVPPLQAPDEPDFLQVFAEVTQRPDVAFQTETLAKIGHLDRIMYHDDERFRPADIGRPLDRPWPPGGGPPPGAGRNSVTATHWWAGLAHVIPPIGAAGSLLAIRLANAVLFALCLAVATLMLLVVSRGEIASPQAVCLTFLLVPTLPFFATYVSEFSILTLAYVFIAAIAVGLFFDTSRAYLLGLPLGIGCSIALASGRNALPFMPMIGALCIGRAMLGSRDDRSGGDDRRRSMWFWAGLAAGLSVYPLMSTAEFRGGLWPPDARQMSERLRDVAEFLRRYPWTLVALTPIGFAIERASAVLRRRLGPPSRPTLGLIRVLAYGAAVAVVANLIASVFTQLPVLWNAELVRTSSVRVYVDHVLQVAASGFRLAGHDVYLSRLFWGGFGWVDAVPGDAFVSLMVMLAAAGVVVTMVHTARARQTRPAVWLALMAIGWGVALVAYAASTYYLHRNLHGRYLVGPYLLTLGICWSSIARFPQMALPGRFRALSIAREWLLLAAVAAIHAYALRFILLRYY